MPAGLLVPDRIYQTGGLQPIGCCKHIGVVEILDVQRELATQDRLL